MINLLITIIIFTYFTICFKWFQRFKVNNFSAIIVNYLVAGILGLFLSKNHSITSSENFATILLFGSIIGFLFIAVFNLTAHSTQQSGIAVTVLVSKIASIVLPISFSIIIGLEAISVKHTIAIALAISSLFFIINFKGESALKSTGLIILLGIFLGQGFADILFSQSNSFVSLKHNEIFFAIIFIVAAISGILFSFLNKHQKFIPSKKNILWGAILGIPNYFSLKFFFDALTELDNSTAFLVLNVGIIILSTFVGLLFYREKLSFKNIIGISLAILSLYLIFR